MNVSVSFYVNFLYKPLESVAALWSVKQAREVGCENKEACTATVNEVASGWKLVWQGGMEVVAAAGCCTGAARWCDVVASPSQNDRKSLSLNMQTEHTYAYRTLEDFDNSLKRFLKDWSLTASHLKAICKQVTEFLVTD